MSQLGRALMASGNFDGALMLFKKILKNLASLGREHPGVAGTYNNIGEVYRQQAKYPEALNMYQKSLDINIKVHGCNHPLVASTMVL